LYKIHVSLGKIVNNLDAAAEAAVPNFRRSVSRATSVGLDDRTIVPDDRTVLHEAEIKEEDEEDGREGDSTTIIRGSNSKGEGDSLVDDLLTDDGEL
jgi:condensin complex subunit 3